MNVHRRLFIILLVGLMVIGWSPRALAAPNRIQKENAQPGTTDWQLTTPADAGQIEGYASLTSVPVGGQIDLFVNTADESYSLTVYRMGWYGGKGGRRVSGPHTLRGVQQPAPVGDPRVDVIECRWARSFSIRVPTAWLSGIYLVKLHGNTSGKESYIIFTVRDARRADLMFQQSVLTYHAYNPWGGQSLYPHLTLDLKQVQAVSMNRPYAMSWQNPSLYGMGAGDFLHNIGPAGMDYNMVRWLEREGYDVTYVTDVDTHANFHGMLRAQAFLSVGHDEYVTREMRSNMYKARDLGYDLGFFGANYNYWPVTLLPDSQQRANRTISLAPNFCSPVGDHPTECASDSDCASGQICTIKACNYACMEDANGVSQTEQDLVGGMWDPGHATDAISAINGYGGDIVVTSVAPLDHWVFANTNLKLHDVIPGLIGTEWNGLSNESHYPRPSGLVTLLKTQVPNFGGAYGENNIGGFLLPDEFNGWDFDGWYEQYVAGGRVLSHECDTSPIPPLMIAPTEGFCRNPWPMHPGVKLDWEMTIYQASSGAWVFNAATNEWAWGLDDYFTGIATPGGPDNGPAVRPQCGYSWFHPNLASCRHPAIEQITRNVLNRFIRGE